MINHEHFTLTYDGSFEGYLCCIFQIYERKLKQVQFKRLTINDSQASDQTILFSNSLEIETVKNQADRVLAGLKKKLSGKELRQLYASFLSEQSGIEVVMLKYIKDALGSAESVRGNYTKDHILKIAQTAKMVGRESHRMEAFVRFQLTKEGLYFANVTPDFDVLPLIATHFESRYADQQWLIYDLKRNYGIYYNLNDVQFVKLSQKKSTATQSISALVFDESEMAFQQLWKEYFKKTNIVARKNTRLHFQHVPKRYWKYLVEKHVK